MKLTKSGDEAVKLLKFLQDMGTDPEIVDLSSQENYHPLTKIKGETFLHKLDLSGHVTD